MESSLVPGKDEANKNHRASVTKNITHTHTLLPLSSAHPIAASRFNSHRPPRSSAPQSRRRCWAPPGGTKPRTWIGSWARGSRPVSCGYRGGSWSHLAARRPQAEASGRGRCGSQRSPSAHRASGGGGRRPYLWGGGRKSESLLGAESRRCAQAAGGSDFN